MRRKELRECDKQENARIAAAECFVEAQKARAKGQIQRAESLENQGKYITRWGGGRR
jgi:hypothetical protein